MQSDEREALENKAWQSLNAQFSLPMMIGKDPAAHTEKVGELACAIRWIESSIAEWSPAATNLADFLFAMAYLDQQNDLIEGLPAKFVSNAEFVQTLGDLVSHAISVPEPSSWFDRRRTESMVGSMDAAWQQGRWSEVVRFHDAVDYFRSNVIVAMSVRVLAKWAPAILNALVDRVENLPSAFMVSSVLDRPGAFQVAAKTSNEMMRFACVYDKLHVSRAALTAGEAAALSQVFVAASGDTTTWRGWMEIFNRYPVRFPQIQSSLGNALAQMSAASVCTYIDAVELHVSPHNERALVAECLSQFASAAGKRKRDAVWKYSHRRWHGWGFGRSSQDTILMDISWSALDYAVTGFYLECCTAAERDATANGLRDELGRVDARWHKSLTTCATQWYRIQSQLQPVIHADKVETTRYDWLDQAYYIVSPIEDQDLYFDYKHLFKTRR